MAPTPDATSSAQLSNNPKIKEEWKRNIWSQKIATRLMTKDKQMIELKSKEKRSPEIFSVHKALLCFYSPYHDRLLNGNFAESLVTPTEPLVINAGGSGLRLFFAWLYSGQIDMATPIVGAADVYAWYTGSTKLYILADELNCVALQRSVISAQVGITEDIESLASFSTIELLTNCSFESSGLYQYHVEVYNTHWSGRQADLCRFGRDSEDPMPQSFAYRVLLMYVEGSRGSAKKPKACACCHDPCKYHRHESEEERKATCGALHTGSEDGEKDILNFNSDPESD